VKNIDTLPSGLDIVITNSSIQHAIEIRDYGTTRN
jgi:hypothetical protein